MLLSSALNINRSIVAAHQEPILTAFARPPNIDLAVPLSG